MGAFEKSVGAVVRVAAGVPATGPLVLDTDVERLKGPRLLDPVGVGAFVPATEGAVETVAAGVPATGALVVDTVLVRERGALDLDTETVRVGGSLDLVRVTLTVADLDRSASL